MFQYFEDEDSDKNTDPRHLHPKRSFENRLLVFADLVSVEEDTTKGLPKITNVPRQTFDFNLKHFNLK